MAAAPIDWNKTAMLLGTFLIGVALAVVAWFFTEGRGEPAPQEESYDDNFEEELVPEKQSKKQKVAQVKKKPRVVEPAFTPKPFVASAPAFIVPERAAPPAVCQDDVEKPKKKKKKKKKRDESSSDSDEPTQVAAPAPMPQLPPDNWREIPKRMERTESEKARAEAISDLKRRKVTIISKMRALENSIGMEVKGAKREDAERKQLETRAKLLEDLERINLRLRRLLDPAEFRKHPSEIDQEEETRGGWDDVLAAWDAQAVSSGGGAANSKGGGGADSKGGGGANSKGVDPGQTSSQWIENRGHGNDWSWHGDNDYASADAEQWQGGYTDDWQNGWAGSRAPWSDNSWGEKSWNADTSNDWNADSNWYAANPSEGKGGKKSKGKGQSGASWDKGRAKKGKGKGKSGGSWDSIACGGEEGTADGDPTDYATEEREEGKGKREKRDRKEKGKGKGKGKGDGKAACRSDGHADLSDGAWDATITEAWDEAEAETVERPRGARSWKVKAPVNQSNADDAGGDSDAQPDKGRGKGRQNTGEKKLRSKGEGKDQSRLQDWMRDKKGTSEEHECRANEESPKSQKPIKADHLMAPSAMLPTSWGDAESSDEEFSLRRRHQDFRPGVMTAPPRHF